MVDIQNQTVLSVDLDAIVQNYNILKKAHVKHDCAAVVKADAYGLGMDRVAQALHSAGCSEFFVATLEEAITLRATLPQAIIYVFQGVLAGEENEFYQHNLRPVLNSEEQSFRWRNIVDKHGLNERTKSALHIDTGMCRLGLSHFDIISGKINNLAGIAESSNVAMIMSHLACASEPEMSLIINS